MASEGTCADSEETAVQHVRKFLKGHAEFLLRYKVPLPKDLTLSGVHEIIAQYKIPRERYDAIWIQAVWDVNKDLNDIGLQGKLGETMASVHIYEQFGPEKSMPPSPVL